MMDQCLQVANENCLLQTASLDFDTDQLEV